MPKLLIKHCLNPCQSHLHILNPLCRKNCIKVILSHLYSPPPPLLEPFPCYPKCFLCHSTAFIGTHTDGRKTYYDPQIVSSLLSPFAPHTIPPYQLEGSLLVGHQLILPTHHQLEMHHSTPQAFRVILSLIAFSPVESNYTIFFKLALTTPSLSRIDPTKSSHNLRTSTSHDSSNSHAASNLKCYWRLLRLSWQVSTITEQ